MVSHANTSTQRSSLPNKFFASKGSPRKGNPHEQLDLFTEFTADCFSSHPQPPILSQIKAGVFFGDGKERLKSLLQAHAHPAKTVDSAVPVDILAGKNTYTYDAHTYHTKVPPQGIVEFLVRYLPNSGLILDPFGGSGMTGVAARTVGMDVILNELSPAASFIGYNFTAAHSPAPLRHTVHQILTSLAAIRRSLYTTRCRTCGKATEILYTVWSYRVPCPSCHEEFVLWDHCRHYGKTVREHKILKEFSCPCCHTTLLKRTLSRTEPIPVLVGYKCCSKTQTEHPLTSEDFVNIREINTGNFLAHGYYPQNDLPEGINLNQPRHHGLVKMDQCYTVRNLSALSHLWREIHTLQDSQTASCLAFVFTSLYQRVTRFSEFRFWGGSGNTARFNVPFIFNEANVFLTFERKAANILDHLETTASHYRGNCVTVCHSATDLFYLPDESIDFIFTDPPFGANIHYSEMNILWESWLGEFTNTSDEVIINKFQGKQIGEYEKLMTKCLTECYRVLRPGHWMLLVFMNSSSQVWEALQSSIRKAGFVTERIDIFDKQHGTIKQFTNENTAGYDLVLHCHKPRHKTLLHTPQEKLHHGASISQFLDNRKKEIPIVNYLHVPRQSELDLRKLYSEWLALSLPKNHEIVDFVEFRKIVYELIDVTATAD